MLICFIVTRRVETLHKTNSTVFALWYAHIPPPSLSLQLSDAYGKTERKRLPYLCYSCSVIMFSISGWLTQRSNTNKRICDTVSWSFVCLRSFNFFLHLIKFLLKQNMASEGGGLSALTPPTCKEIAITLLSCTHLSLTKLPYIVVPHRNCVCEESHTL